MSPAPSAAVTDAATPAMLAAAWRAFRVGRTLDPLGPGPAFVEAINAALAAADSPYVTTRLVEAADRAAKAEARAEKAEADRDEWKKRCQDATDVVLAGDIEADEVLAQVAALTARAEKAEAEAQANRNSALLDDIEVAREEVTDLTAKLDDTRVDLALANKELFFLRAGAKDDADKIADLTRKLDEARGVLLALYDSHQPLPPEDYPTHKQWAIGMPGSWFLSLAAVIAPETVKESRE